MASQKVTLSKRLQGHGGNIWLQMDKLVEEYQALNLGKGFPDSFPPDHVKQALMEAIQTTSPLDYQYTRTSGHPRLVKVLADLFSPTFGHTIDPLDEVLITIGAFGSLFATLQSLVNPGDEVILIEPYFDCFERLVLVSGGIPVFVPLRPTKADVTSSADFKLDPSEFESKFSSKTKAIIFNTPNNPLGKVFTREETELVANLCKKHDVIVIADEVYEFLIFPPNKHVKIATLPDMWERTLTIGSAGKVFNATGLRIGWTIGPKHLVRPCQMMQQNCLSSCPTPIQKALATSFEIEMARLEQPECYFKCLASELLPKRDYLAETLGKSGMEPVLPEGGYFMVANFSKSGAKYDDGSEDTRGFKFVRWMIKEKKLAGIPLSAFYGKEHKHLGEKYVRFCFIKEDSSLEKAGKILQNWT